MSISTGQRSSAGWGLGPELSGAAVPTAEPGAAWAAEPEPAAAEAGAIVSLTVVGDALRRRRKIWVAAGLAGLLLGAAFHLLVPAKYTAVANLYLVEPPNSDQAQAISNDVGLLETPAVSGQALAALHLRGNAMSFLGSYQGVPVGTDILSIEFVASSPAQAVAYDNAVASAFLSRRASELVSQTNILIGDLNTQIQALNSDIANLTAAINSLTTAPAGSQSADELTNLVNQRSSDYSQISSLQGEESQDIIDEDSVIKGSQVLDPAAALSSSIKKVIVEDAASGLIAALGLSLGTLAVLAIISDRPRRREQVATALAAPVEFSIGKYHPCRGLRRWRLSHRLKKPSRELRLVEARLRAVLEQQRRPVLAAVEIEASQPAALAVASLARSLAADGKRVLVVDLAESFPFRLLSRPVRTSGEGQPLRRLARGDVPVLRVPPSTPFPPDRRLLGDVDYVLVLASTNPALGADSLSAWATTAVVTLTVGKVSSTRLQACQEMLRQAGVSLSSAIVIGSDPWDETAGSLGVATLVPSRPAQTWVERGRLTDTEM
ncbi:MAG TPA: hypothetical protein VEJ84_03635 [Acidimicrobiales bacterium]|nr:hypothetical protein [Acidimicrobiales bacterium]